MIKMMKKDDEEMIKIGDEDCVLDSDDNGNLRGRRKITLIRNVLREDRLGRTVTTLDIYTDSESCGESEADSYHSSNTHSDRSCNDSDNIPCHLYKGKENFNNKGSGHHN